MLLGQGLGDSHSRACSLGSSVVPSTQALKVCTQSPCSGGDKRGKNSPLKLKIGHSKQHLVTCYQNILILFQVYASHMYNLKFSKLQCKYATIYKDINFLNLGLIKCVQFVLQRSSSCSLMCDSKLTILWGTEKSKQ